MIFDSNRLVSVLQYSTTQVYYNMQGNRWSSPTI